MEAHTHSCKLIDRSKMAAKDVPPWCNSEAKKLLTKDIINKVVKPEMDANVVFRMRPEHKLYDKTRFKANLKNLRESIASGKHKIKPTGWGQSEAKETLRTDILTGIVEPEMLARDVYRMRPEYQEYELVNFSTNLDNLRKAIIKDIGRMQKDCEWCGHDLQVLFDVRGENWMEEREIQWQQSEAKELLMKAIDNGVHLDTKFEPKNLWSSESAYMEFTLTEFRKHIHQEVRARSSRKTRFDKKKLRLSGPQLTKPLAVIDELPKSTLKKHPDPNPTSSSRKHKSRKHK